MVSREEAKRSLALGNVSGTDENVDRLLLGYRAFEEPITKDDHVALYVKDARSGKVRMIRFSIGLHKIDKIHTTYIVGSMLRNAAARGDHIFVDPDCKRKLPDKC